MLIVFESTLHGQALPSISCSIERTSVFMSDQLADHRRFRILNIVDDYSRFCPGQIVDLSISGARGPLGATPPCRSRPCKATPVATGTLERSQGECP
jgi:hypothetical protein